jgi:hypothetical protein
VNDSAPRPAVSEEEQNRPYRRFVGVMFALAIAALCGLVLRGIVRHLDRMPSPSALERPDHVDDRALRACAEDLDRLIGATRKAAGRAFAAPAANTWPQAARELEMERISIVARCHLDEPTEDGVAQQLAAAAEGIEGSLRSYSLLYARHLEDGLKRSEEAHKAIESALEALRSR